MSWDSYSWMIGWNDFCDKVRLPPDGGVRNSTHPSSPRLSSLHRVSLTVMGEGITTTWSHLVLTLYHTNISSYHITMTNTSISIVFVTIVMKKNLICKVIFLIKAFCIEMSAFHSTPNQRDIIPLKIKRETKCYPSLPHRCSYMGPIKVWGWQRLVCFSALWTLWSNKQGLPDLQANSSQTCQSWYPGLFGLAPVQQGQQNSAFLKLKKLTALAATQIPLCPYLFPKCGGTHRHRHTHTEHW